MSPIPAGTTEARMRLAGEHNVTPVIRVERTFSSRYAPLDVPMDGDVDVKVANIEESKNAADVNPTQFVIVIGEGVAILPLNYSKPELRLTLGAEHVHDLGDRVRKAKGVHISPASGEDPECDDIVIGYQVLGRAPGADRRATGKPVGKSPNTGQRIGPGQQQQGAPAIFDGNFQPAFMESRTITAASSFPAEDDATWAEYLHGPLTFRCTRYPPSQPDVSVPGKPPTTTGPFQRGRTSPGSPAPFSPAFLDSDGENVAAEGDEA